MEVPQTFWRPRVKPLKRNTGINVFSWSVVFYSLISMYISIKSGSSGEVVTVLLYYVCIVVQNVFFFLP